MEQSTGKNKDLLRRYALKGSQAAFSLLVERHMKLVYSTCYRELLQRELAEEATQAVFLVLARKARTIRSEQGLASWLYATARFEAGAILRRQRRRMRREHQAFVEAQHRYERSEEEAWRSVDSNLNDCLSALGAADREAILLRFFDQMSLREVGAAMGTNEEAAQKRVSRALEKLRAALVNRKAVGVSAVALSALLTRHATYAVPAHLPASVAQSAGAVPVSSSAMPASQLFRPLNPLIAKGLLIVTTSKIVAGGVAAAVVLLGLTLIIVHRAHSTASVQPAIEQSAQPGLGQSVGPFTLIWDTAPPPDTATQQAEQQISSEAAQIAAAIIAGNANKILAMLSPSFIGVGGGGNILPYADVASQLPQAMKQYPKPLPKSRFTVTSCAVFGDTATLNVVTRIGRPAGRGIFVVTLTRIGGQWLISKMKVQG